MTAAKQDRIRRQQEIDRIQAQARRDGVYDLLFKPRPEKTAPLVKSGNELEIRLAGELDYIRRVLDGVGDQLANDPIVLQRHAVTLQSFDLIGQMIGHISSIIGAADRSDALDRVGIEEMKKRLERGALE
jgi:hypothetical protein